MSLVAYGEDDLLTVLDALALSPDAVFAIDDRRRIIFWNKAMQALLGFTYDEVARRSCSSALNGLDQFGNRYCWEGCAILATASRGDSIHPFRLQMRARSGELVPLDLTVMKFVIPSTRRLVLAYTARRTEPAELPKAEKPREKSEREPVDARVRALTAREVEVLSMVAEAQNASEIAEHLCISRLTARNHIQRIFQKIEVHSKAEAVAFAYRMHIV